jgi:hypothetical protein
MLFSSLLSQEEIRKAGETGAGLRLRLGHRVLALAGGRLLGTRAAHI